MYKITDIPPLPLALLAQGGPVIATKIDPRHPFRDGRSILDEVIGRRVTVTFPAAGYAQLEVKVESTIDMLTPLLAKATYTAPVYVDFDGFDAHFWESYDKITKQTRTILTVKASAVRVVPGPSDGLDID